MFCTFDPLSRQNTLIDKTHMFSRKNIVFIPPFVRCVTSQRSFRNWTSEFPQKTLVFLCFRDLHIQIRYTEENKSDQRSL